MVRFKALRRAGAVAWLWLLLLAVSPAAASPFDIALVGAPTPVAGGFLWNYQLILAGAGPGVNGERVQDEPNTPVPPNLTSSRPDFFVIYDFLGYVDGSIAVAGGIPWVGTVENFTALADRPDLQQGVFDDPNIPNLRFTRTPGADTAGPAAIPGFTAVSVFGEQRLGFASAEITNNGGLADNTNNVGTVSTPVPTPEPATLLLVLAGPVFVFGAVKRGLRRRQT
jgi:hypothetical protein